MSGRFAPVVRGRIERRLLIDVVVDPDLVRPELPDGLRPRLVDGAALVGVCLLRLSAVRPIGTPAALGLSSDNVAHRIAVEWDEPGDTCTGVFVVARHSTSWAAVAGGGRLAPGVHRHATVRSDESADRWRIELAGGAGGSDGPALVVAARLAGPGEGAPTPTWCGPADLGLSLDHRERIEAARMEVEGWHIEPVVVDELRSWWLDDPRRFPPGSLRPATAALQRRQTATWRRMAWGGTA